MILISMKIATAIIILLAIAAAIWGYASYFKVEQKSIETSTTALEEAKQAKAMLEQRSAGQLKEQ